MAEQIEHVRRPRISPAVWVGLAFMTLIGLMVAFQPHSAPIIERVRKIDIEVSAVRTALRDYEATFGAFPSGESPAVFRALRGQNPRQIVFLHCPAESVSPDGSMVDPWGTPYRVYFSGKEVLVRSAGPNKLFDEPGARHFDDCIR
jgi:hypothetical protein